MIFMRFYGGKNALSTASHLGRNRSTTTMDTYTSEGTSIVMGMMVLLFIPKKFDPLTTI